MRIPLLLAALTLAGAGAASAQQAHDSTAPFNFAADHIELQDKAHRALLSGKVSVQQAEMTLTAARMTISYTGEVVNGAKPEAQRVDASGGVIVTRPDQTARSNFAVYDLNRRTILLIGDVVLTQGGNVTRGPRLTLDLNRGKRSAVLGGGRVSGTFSVPKRN